jgi:hypothetical protein
LSLTVKDDFLDGDNQNPDSLILSNIFLEKYVELNKPIFSDNSIFWKIFAESLAEWYAGETWEHTSNLFEYNSLSKEFLLKSSSKLAMLTVPTLASFPILAKEENKIGYLVDMIKNYSIGFKLIDDLADWKIDLKKKNFNCSSLILSYILSTDRNISSEGPIEIDISTLILTTDLIDMIYSSAYDYFRESLKCLDAIGSPNLKLLIEGRMQSIKNLKESVTSSKNAMASQLNSMYESYAKTSKL